MAATMPPSTTSSVEIIDRTQPREDDVAGAAFAGSGTGAGVKGAAAFVGTSTGGEGAFGVGELGVEGEERGDEGDTTG